MAVSDMPAPPSTEQLIQRRVFHPESFWNLPVPVGAEADPESDRLCALLRSYSPQGGFHVNLHAWTIPVYEVEANSARQVVRRKIHECAFAWDFLKASRSPFDDSHPLGHHKSMRRGIPIPENAATDDQGDAHMVILDRAAGIGYDLWQAQRNDNGVWAANSAISYPLDGDGLWHKADFPDLQEGESVHLYGPCRASGVPSVAGLIMHEEIEAGWIPHKLAYACECPAFGEYVSPPALWTDGWLPGGLPEGSVLQLDPALDLAAFDLSRGALVVARALQEYGAVLVDFSGGVTLYGEYLSAGAGRSWDGLMDENDLRCIGFEHFRVLRIGARRQGGSHPRHHGVMRHKFEEYEAMQAVMDESLPGSIPSSSHPI